jgi:segregation and condensation protein A
LPARAAEKDVTTDPYKFELDVFEGPLDLLLYLIKREEVDIYNIPIETITTQYMEYLDLMRMLDLNIAGEFIVMAATLMMIKSRMLLPVDERPEDEDGADEDDPRWDLVRRLVEYKKFKDAALALQDREARQENVFAAGGEGVVLEPDPGLALRDVSLFDLITAFQGVLKRARPETMGEVFAESLTVADKIDALLTLLAEGGRVLFSELFDGTPSRHEVICTFLALLELIRLRQVCAVQRERFGDIALEGIRDEAPAGAGVATVEAR